MTDLPADDLSGLVMDRACRLAQSHDFDSVADGCKRVPQLMTEHRQEFVFASVRLANPGIQQRVIQSDRDAPGEFRHNSFLRVAEDTSGGESKQRRPEPPAARQQWEHSCVLDRQIKFY